MKLNVIKHTKQPTSRKWDTGRNLTLIASRRARTDLEAARLESCSRQHGKTYITSEHGPPSQEKSMVPLQNSVEPMSHFHGTLAHPQLDPGATNTRDASARAILAMTMTSSSENLFSAVLKIYLASGGYLASNAACTGRMSPVLCILTKTMIAVGMIVGQSWFGLRDSRSAKRSLRYQGQ